MSVSKDLVDIIKGSDDKGTKAYDTPATVTRVDGSTVWVHIPGGVDETPVKKTINAKQGDTVQVRVSGGSAWLNGNASAPPTDDTQANVAVEYALVAGNAAESAVKSASIASEAAADAKATADSVHGIALQALADAATAKGAADNASEYAARALGNLSTVQSVTETLTWITQHGTMALTTDVALDPTHVYFVVDAGGDYVVGGVTYAIVTEPDVDDIGTYYELTIDESLNNYVGTHLALTSEGLWLLPASTGTNKVLVATGAGSVYTTAGTYIIDSDGTTVLASFRADGATIGEDINGQSRSEISTDGMQIYQNVNGSDVQIANLGYGPGINSSGTTSNAPYYSLGVRTSTVGNYSTAEGYSTEASNYTSHAEGYGTVSSGQASHAEGWNTTASGDNAHAEGFDTDAGGTMAHAEGFSTTASGDYSHADGYASTASGEASHAQNNHTIAQRKSQTTIGEYNLVDTTGADGTARGDYILIAGNGSSGTRSNALTLDWGGNVSVNVDTTASPGTVDGDLYSAITASGVTGLSAGMLRFKQFFTSILNKLTTKTITPTITASTGVLVSSACKKYGNVVHLRLTFRNGTATAAGGNAFVATINGPIPDVTAVGIGYYSSSALVLQITDTGAINVRVIGAQLPAMTSSNSATMSVVYISSS